MFSPIQSVCLLEHAKALTTVKMLLKYGLYQDYLAITSPQQRMQLEWLREELKK